MTVSPSSLDFHDLDSFEEYGPISSLSLSNVFLMAGMGLWTLGKNTTEAKCHSHPIPAGVSESHKILVMLTFINWLR